MPAEIPEARILKAVREVIFERGYHGATTKQIALAAGIGEATLFRRFGTKEALLLEALKVEAAQFTQEAIAYTGNIEGDLERIVLTYYRLLKQQGFLMLEIVGELPHQPELWAIMQSPWEAMSSIAALLERYQKEKQLQGEFPWQATLALLGPLVMTTIFKQFVPLLPAPLEPGEHVRRFLEGWKYQQEKSETGQSSVSDF